MAKNICTKIGEAVIKRIFIKQRLLISRSILLLLLSGFLLYFDLNGQSLKLVRSTVSTALAQVQYLVYMPIELLSNIETNFISNKELLAQNEQLHAENSLLQAKIQRIDFLLQENNELRKLLDIAKHLSANYLATELIALNIDNLSFQATIDKGKQQGVFVGQAVIDAFGVVGQVVAVEALSSRILLLFDPKSAIPVVSTRNGLQSIAVGVAHDDDLELLNIIETADVKVGDTFVTSGLGQRFPAGYKVGVVSAVERHPSERFAKVVLVPSAHIFGERHLLLVRPEK